MMILQRNTVLIGLLLAGGLRADEALDVTWKNGLRFTSADESFEFRPRLFVQLDATAFADEESANAALAAAAEEGETPDQLENGAEVRRARTGFEGTLYNTLGFEVIYDFAGDQAEPVDVYVALLQLPVVGTLRVGHQREPFSRLQGGSANYIFLEKGLQDALVPDRNLGLRVLQNAAGDRVAWSAGAYFDTDKAGATTDGDAYDLVARVSGLPWYEPDRGRLLHLGAAYAYRRPPEGAFDFGARPDAHLAPTLVGRDDIPADAADLYGAEAALVLGPLSFLGEYVRANLDAASDATLDGFYATASYFLTGETRGYDLEEGKLGGVKPRRNYGAGGGGAWELTARVSAVDLNDGAVQQGELQDLTLALNWYLNPNVKCLLNYVRADADERGEVDIVQGRVQLSF